MRLAAIGLMAALALACGGIADGLRYNGTSSYPVGFYLSGGKRAQRGDLVFVSLPSSLVLDMARERGYLNVAYCSVNHLLKRLDGTNGRFQQGKPFRQRRFGRMRTLGPATRGRESSGDRYARTNSPRR